MTDSIRAKRWGRKRTTSSRQVGDDPAPKSGYAPRETRSYDEKRLKDLALFYCSKRETSRPKLQQYLARKVNLQKQPEAAAWIETIILDFERLNVINHERYADILNREYARRGKGKRYIQQKIKEKGLKEQLETIEFKPDDELTRAIEVAAKMLEKTTFKKIEDSYLKKQKLLTKMVTQGFDYSIAKKAVELALKKE